MDGVGWDEVVEIRLDSGEVRHGVVLEVDRRLAVIQVFEGTSGLALDAVRVSFGGGPMRIPVGDELARPGLQRQGRAARRRPAGARLDRREIGGWPINPAARATPGDPILTGVSVIDGLATLVRGQKLPIFSVGGFRTWSSLRRSRPRRPWRTSRSRSSSLRWE